VNTASSLATPTANVADPSLLSRARLGRLGRFVSAQMLVQVLGFVGGLLLVRSMVQTDYGHYTLAISLVGLFNVLLDLGLSTALLAHGGALHHDRKQLGLLLADAFKVQRWLALVGTAILLPAAAVMFVWQGMSTWEVAALCTLIVVCGLFNVYNALALSVMRLRGDLAAQQRLDVVANAFKLMAFALATVTFLDARVAMAVNALIAMALLLTLRRYLRSQLGARLAGEGQHVPALLSYIRRQAPNTLYYCFSGQVTTWLVAALGTAERVADLGALGRLAALFSVITAVVAAVVQPYFARARTAQELRQGFLALNGFFVAMTATLCTVTLVAPQLLLWVLGPRYAGLTQEVVWMALSASLSAWSGAVYAVGAARNCLVPSWVVIPSGLLVFVLALQWFDVSTVLGNLMLNTSAAGLMLALTLGYVGWRLLRTLEGELK
jgi:O-antigen/teichoic acid export membrane protein